VCRTTGQRLEDGFCSDLQDEGICVRQKDWILKHALPRKRHGQILTYSDQKVNKLEAFNC